MLFRSGMVVSWNWLRPGGPVKSLALMGVATAEPTRVAAKAVNASLNILVVVSVYWRFASFVWLVVERCCRLKTCDSRSFNTHLRKATGSGRALHPPTTLPYNCMAHIMSSPNWTAPAVGGGASGRGRRRVQHSGQGPAGRAPGGCTAAPART